MCARVGVCPCVPVCACAMWRSTDSLLKLFCLSTMSVPGIGLGLFIKLGGLHSCLLSHLDSTPKITHSSVMCPLLLSDASGCALYWVYVSSTPFCIGLNSATLQSHLRAGVIGVSTMTGCKQFSLSKMEEL